MRYFLVPLLVLVSGMACAASAADELAYRTITVTGDAEVKKEPDQAIVSIGIEEQNAKLEVARKATDDQLKALFSIAKSMGIEDKDMQTTYSSIQPVYDYTNNATRVFRGYNVNHQVQITLKKPDQLAALTEKLLAAKIDQINNVEYGLQKKDEAESEALKKALAKAKEKAAMMASAYDESLGKVLVINESGVQSQPVPMMMKARMAPMSVASDAVESAPPAGEVSITANVTVTFSLK